MSLNEVVSTAFQRIKDKLKRTNVINYARKQGFTRSTLETEFRNNSEKFNRFSICYLKEYCMPYTNMDYAALIAVISEELHIPYTVYIYDQDLDFGQNKIAQYLSYVAPMQGVKKRIVFVESGGRYYKIDGMLDVDVNNIVPEVIDKMI